MEQNPHKGLSRAAVSSSPSVPNIGHSSSSTEKEKTSSHSEIIIRDKEKEKSRERERENQKEKKQAGSHIQQRERDRSSDASSEKGKRADYTSHKLTTVPDQVFSFSNIDDLKTLVLRTNEISIFSGELSQLRSLTCLNFSQNLLKGIILIIIIIYY